MTNAVTGNRRPANFANERLASNEEAILMEEQQMRVCGSRRKGILFVLLVAGSTMIASAVSERVIAAPKVIELTQVACQFLESEKGVDHGYKSMRKADCEAINAKTAEQRLAESKTIVLSPGDYIFRVRNKNVPYDLGFWLRGDGVVAFATLPSVSGGGLSMGKTRDYRITLKPGNYTYSCPLNPTPNYKLVVKQ